MKKIILLVFAGLLSTVALAQQANLSNSTKPILDTVPLDGVYRKGNLLDAKVTPYANIREADVIYRKRIWRQIDLRQKMNRPYASPKSRLIDVIMNAVMSGELTAYANLDGKDSLGRDLAFTQILTATEAKAKFADSVVIPEIDSTGQQIGSHMAAGEFNPDSILRFQIKEDWLFDKQRSVWERRIISIAPMVTIRAAGQDLGEIAAFQIYFPEARHIFVTKEVVNAHNDAIGLSYDDIFVKGLFDSYIVKQSNNDDLRIKDYAIGIDRLYESERIKKELMDWEHDLWSY
ncbi:gliding motility protein GldN [Hufsiella ginkgonis]|uniref:Gliding motility protein GldN n=1 Tax=Hufsiella ginkgonis TaxID=2695274 RepID=A0A7K1Y2S3_9SPHI|nr:gliding motility protein GldN [Hufsiella ginkgonis]MXV17584.1 gliding motility protein GldN [Hufsiella ginkgonis]